MALRDARPTGSITHVSINFEGLQVLADRLVAEKSSADVAIRKTHTFLAKTLQARQAQALEERVRTRGRAQRSAIRSGLLYKAIISKNNREVDVHGFTVGYLEDEDRFPKVSQYAGGLEEGTSSHLFTHLHGYWVTRGGFAVNNVPEGVDAVRFSGFYADQGGFSIKKPIIGYHYQAEGYRRWVQDGYAGKDAVAAYADFFDESGGRNFANLFRRAHGGTLRANTARIKTDTAFMPDS
jgi:hypothetical protein